MSVRILDERMAVGEEGLDSLGVLRKYIGVTERPVDCSSRQRTSSFSNVEKSNIFSANLFNGSVIPDSRYPRP